MPQQKYKTLIIDPPWLHNQLGNYGAHKHYRLMNMEQLKAMPIKNLTEENSAIFLWTTNSTVRHALSLLDSWGFAEKGILTWVKMRMGLGNYLRNATEQVILATRGKIKPLCKTQLSWFTAPTAGHSVKPNDVHVIAERMFPGPYLELFARRKRPGWSVWGDQVESDIAISGYPVPDSPATRTKGGQDE